MEHFVSTTNPSTISSMILLALVPSVSIPLPFIPKSLISWFKLTIIMHQAMLLTVQARISSVTSVPELTCYSRPCVGAGYHRLLYHTLLATWNWVCWLLSQVGDFFLALIRLCWPRRLVNFWGCSARYIAATGRSWLSQVSDSDAKVVGNR